MTLFFHELKRDRVKLLVWTAAITFMLCVSIFIYPMMASQMNEMSDMFADMGAFSSAYNMDKIKEHQKILDNLHTIYITKNHDYGDSVHDTYKKYGLTSFLVRMEDKLNRVRTLNQNTDMQVPTEKIEDTLLDLANYAILAVMELKLEEEK